MGLGRMNRHIDIVEVISVKDREGFATPVDVVRASVRAYKEDRRGSESWRNRAAFSTTNALFRFRVIPGLTVSASMLIICGGECYDITHVENVRHRGLYYECLAEKHTSSMGGSGNAQDDP